MGWFERLIYLFAGKKTRAMFEYLLEKQKEEEIESSTIQTGHLFYINRSNFYVNPEQK